MTESRNVLTRHRLRSTDGRLRILRLLESAPVPLSAAQVHEGLGEDGPDLATVYRTLDRFSSASLISAVRFSDGTRRFEIARNTHHHHLVCTTCGSIADMGLCRVEPLVDHAFEQHGFTVASHSLEFYGTCRDCSRPAAQ
jgi:Fur family transcriptional regulator, ferric uptake regulator